MSACSLLKELSRRLASCSNLSQHSLQLSPHAFRLDSEHTIARADELAITALVGAAPLGVIAAIDLDDEPRRRREKIDDEAEDRHLPAKGDAKLARPQRTPERGFGVSGRDTHAVSVSAKE